eukprot:CAMPEP_0184010540 /NCGR_PEP_ID=MMETSP0954-20121128/3272_1 /TAXON_ID=627963 /ORGANISM="Aplanochytrium sp, Strain PBS07" /LENGTH=821 /DNA_ID=CAMNT_0026290145 /DNA_START=186 /DNA_END=2651 /DNA_ORIENTATION=-
MTVETLFKVVGNVEAMASRYRVRGVTFPRWGKKNSSILVRQGAQRHNGKPSCRSLINAKDSAWQLLPRLSHSKTNGGQKGFIPLHVPVLLAVSFWSVDRLEENGWGFTPLLADSFMKAESIKQANFENRYGVKVKSRGEHNSEMNPKKYTVVGLGAYGEVIKGYDKLMDRKVAIKVVEKEAMDAEAIKAEIEALKSSRMHPNVLEFLELYDCEETDSWYLVTELCEGGELFEMLIQNGAYTEGTASRLIARIISAVQHIHKSGYVHLDIKPENLVFAKPVDKNNNASLQIFEIKLCDFGMAKSLDNLGKDQMINSHVGTTAYWSPELLRPFMDSLNSNMPEDKNLSEVGGDLRACDMWAIGIITYIILLGCHPFDPKGTANDQELAKRIISGEKPSYDIHGDLVVLSKEAKDFISRLLDPNPRTRITCNEAIHHDWIRKHREFSASEKALPNAAERLKEYSELTKAQRAFASAVLLASLSSMERKKSNEYRVNAKNSRASSISENQDSERNAFLKLAFDLLDKEGSGKVKPQHISDILAKIEDDSNDYGPDEIKGDGITFTEFIDHIQNGHTMSFKPGQNVYKKGDTPKGLYIIVSGCAQVNYTCEGGKVRPVSQLGPGEIFGEVALLDGRCEYNATITCTEPTEVLFWGKEDFIRAVSNCPDLATSISKSIKRKQIFRARTLIESMENLKVERFKKGDILFKEGDNSDSLYLVRKGAVESVVWRKPKPKSGGLFSRVFGRGNKVSNEEAVEVVIETSNPGDILGSCAVTGGRYAATARCASDVEVTKLSQEDLKKISTQPSLMSNLIRLSHKQTESTWNS